MGPQVRLDPSDALFVDVIHTDARSFFLLEIPGYGMSDNCGHIDFYPNGGKEQPGCALSQEGGTLIPLTLIKDGIEEASRVLLACNHVRAIKLFIDSINGKCPYVGSYTFPFVVNPVISQRIEIPYFLLQVIDVHRINISCKDVVSNAPPAIVPSWAITQRCPDSSHPIRPRTKSFHPNIIISNSIM